MQFGVQRRPEFAQPVEVHSQIPTGQMLIGVQDHFEAVDVHPPAGMAGGDVRQPVGGFEAEPPPDVRVFVAVQIGALVAGALDADPFEPRHRQPRAQPAGQVFVGRYREVIVQPGIIQGRHDFSQSFGKPVGFAAGKRCPVRRQLGPDPRQEVVAVQAAGAR